MEEKRLKIILKKIQVSGNLDLEDLKNLTLAEEKLIRKLYSENSIEEAVKLLTDLNTDNELQLIKTKLIYNEKNVMPLWKSVLKYAAIFIGLFVSIYFLQTKEVIENEIQFTEDNVELKMGDGKIQLIDLKETRIIVSSTGKKIGKQVGSKISYIPNSKINELIFNELEIPYGKVFNLELSDGSVINLNSGTKIRYPIKFLEGKKREVFIDGEGYFDVAKDKDHPFIVNAAEVAIEVLGTEFNVSSYKEDTETITVLVEGSVKMSNNLISNSILTPGMKGAWNKSNQKINVDKVDTDLFVGWVNNELIFRNSTFNSIAKTLERKYNVSIENKNKALSENIFTATFNTKIESIEEVLKVINEISAFDYTIEKNHIIIEPKNEKL